MFSSLLFRIWLRQYWSVTTGNCSFRRSSKAKPPFMQGAKQPVLRPVPAKAATAHDSVIIISSRPAATASTGQRTASAIFPICRSVASADTVMPAQPSRTYSPAAALLNIFNGQSAYTGIWASISRSMENTLIEPAYTPSTPLCRACSSSRRTNPLCRCDTTRGVAAHKETPRS